LTRRFDRIIIPAAMYNEWLHSVGAVVRNSLRMDERHFRFDLSRDDALTLFNQHVELIEIETTSYCNRVCSFCPNGFIDRLSEKNTMPEATWDAILSGLNEVDYSGALVWSRYSEPLSERRILERIKQVRSVAPSARICINSNGDFLDAGYLVELEHAGLHRLWVDVYFPDDDLYDFNSARKYHDKFVKRIKRPASLLRSTPELSYRIASDRLEFVTHVRNVAAMKAMDMSDRGGLVQIARQTVRTSPCYAPFKHLVIDWDGSVVICCQLRSDSPTHSAGVVGKIGQVDLIEAYVRLADWRKTLRGYGPKKSPCSTCNVSEYQSTSLTRSLSRMLTAAHSPVQVAAKALLGPALRKKMRF
jgi:MoaA/NifB/PqqE/SkfB family radical SAM enzyme